jgi:cytochrome c
MKNQKWNLFSTALIILILANSSFAQTGRKKNIPVKKASSAVTSSADIETGKALIQKADCMSCHKLDVKLVGPAFHQVAAKYPATESNYASLAARVISGGAGVWGQVPMSAHSALSQLDAKKMVKYILSLK